MVRGINCNLLLLLGYYFDIIQKCQFFFINSKDCNIVFAFSSLYISLSMCQRVVVSLAVIFHSWPPLNILFDAEVYEPE